METKERDLKLEAKEKYCRCCQEATGHCFYVLNGFIEHDCCSCGCCLQE